MKLDDVEQSMEGLSEEELLVLLADLRRSKDTVTQSKTKEVRKRTKAKSGKALVKSMTDAEKAELKKQLGL